MIELLTQAELEQLYNSEGAPAHSVEVSTLEPGQVVRVRTKSDNTYLFEVRDPQRCAAEVWRKEPRGPAQSGKRGYRKISQTIRVGHRVRHGQQATTPVVWIDILPPPKAA